MGSYNGLQVTELDSHANMSVAGNGTTVIAKSGNFATVTPFSPDLPVLEKVEIGDAAMCYDDPVTLRTYILVMRNALLIPTMNHNLLPPFLVREAGLFLDETPKHQAVSPSIDNHSIYDSRTGMRIHLQLQGIFSYFVTRPLSLEEQENWEAYPLVSITPDGDSWDPHSSHFAEEEAAMVDHYGVLVERTSNKDSLIFGSADVSAADVSPMTWDRFDEMASHVALDDPVYGYAFDGDELSRLASDGIRLQLASLDVGIFANGIMERAHISHASMAMGSVSIVDDACEIFEKYEPTTRDKSASIAAVTAKRSGGVNAEHLSKIFCIPHDDAARTLSVTTQLVRHNPDSSLSRNATTNDRALRYRKIKSNFFTDTLFATAKAKSTRGNICGQVFASDKAFVYFVPMKDQRSYFSALKQFAKEVGAPEVLVCDSHPTQKKRDVKEFCVQIGTTLRVLEAETQWANRAELYVGLLKEATRKDMRATGSPLVLWDYCMERRALIFQVTAKKLFQLNGTNPHTATFGTEADISHLCVFGWYEWVYYRDQSASYPYQKECLGRCLGPAKNEGNIMAQWVLKENGRVVPRRTLRRLTQAESVPSNEVESTKRATYNASITRILGDSVAVPVGPLPDPQEEDPYDLEPYGDDVHDDVPLMPEADFVDAAGKPMLQQSFTDTLINVDVLLPKGDSDALAKVMRRSVDANGKVIGSFNENPLLNTILYECEFEDGLTKEYTANMIASNIYEESDADGHSSLLLYHIVDHKRSGDAISMEDKYFVTKTGTKRIRQTTVGWKLLVQWSDGSRQWIALRILKESNPVQVAEYAFARGLGDEPAFAWWIPYTLRKRDVIVSAVNSRL